MLLEKDNNYEGESSGKFVFVLFVYVLYIKIFVIYILRKKVISFLSYVVFSINVMKSLIEWL